MEWTGQGESRVSGGCGSLSLENKPYLFGNHIMVLNLFYISGLFKSPRDVFPLLMAHLLSVSLKTFPLKKKTNSERLISKMLVKNLDICLAAPTTCQVPKAHLLGPGSGISTMASPLGLPTWAAGSGTLQQQQEQQAWTKTV